MDKVRIVEVGPRDGLQNEAHLVTPVDRIVFIEKLIGTGLTTIETGSFVSPKWVPQMAGTDEVLRAFSGRTHLNFPVLVPNETGLDAALKAGAREIAVFAAASETFSKRNINCTIAESIDRFRPVVARARERGVKIRAYISCALGCPYEGNVPVAQVVDLAEQLHDLGAYEISLGDTIGVGTPAKARDLVHSVGTIVPIERIAVHFHDTYGQALANIYASLEAGVRVVDSAVAGLGGCPYAKGASGNVATEDLLYMLNGIGMETGVDLPRLIDVATWISAELGKPIGSKVGRAMAGNKAAMAVRD
jgi:isopropylmalate/homocitrate/citramalate synthase